MLTYRPVGQADFDFLYWLHRAAMRAYVEETFGPWDEAWQQEYFRRHFDPANLQVIQWDGEDVGSLFLQDRTEELFIAGIEILPEYQQQGIGSQVIRGLLEQANRQSKPVALQVLKVNIRARNLYQRLGFGVTGENDTHYILAYHPKRAG
jgi:ribosomal protein S18 acetylase RimI-like enzyme